MLALGEFPIIGLADARRRRDDAKRLLASGKDPSVERKLEKIAAADANKNTFGIIANEFLERAVAGGAAEQTVKKNRWLLQDLCQPIAKRPITEITPAEILNLLQLIERTGRRETARRLRGMIGAVYRHAIVTLRATNDPTFALRGALLRPQTQPRAAILDEREFGRLIAAIETYDGWPTIRAALLFTALTCARPGEVRGARRGEIDFDRALWRIPAEKMKMRRPHDIPLSRQALDVLRSVWPLSKDNGLIFPSIRAGDRPLSENAMNSALRRMGYTQEEVSAHGFRASGSTILNERGVNPDVIEAVLGHQDKNSIRRAYNRATYMPERIKLMQTWADLIDQFKSSESSTARSS